MNFVPFSLFSEKQGKIFLTHFMKASQRNCMIAAIVLNLGTRR
jgi:hypothetical protein